MFDHHRYTTLRPNRVSYYLLLLVMVLVAIVGGYSALTMEHAGHIITGMNNHVVWGMPHVFAVSLIVTASGALNGATLSSVFGQALYKPWARFSVVLSMSLLMGGLLVLVLDLGRPDRLIVAMTHYNFRSIFAWNIFLYTGLLIIGAGYLWMMMEKRFNRFSAIVGRLAFAWRIVLTTGTGSIFGFLVGRDALDAAILAPLFVALSLVMGSAALALAIKLLDRWHGNLLTQELMCSLQKLLIWFLLVLLYFSIVQHLTNLYVTEHHSVERYTLTGALSPVFWIGHILVGVLVPVYLFCHKPKSSKDSGRFVTACVLALLGGMAWLYVLIIGSQSTPQRLFPDKTVLVSSFGDAGFPMYRSTAWEWGLGLGGIALTCLICLVVMRVLPLLPEGQTLHESTTK